MGISNLLLYAIPLFILAIFVEYQISKKRKKSTYNKSDLMANLGNGVGDILLGGLATSYTGTFYYFIYHLCAPWRMEYLGFSGLGFSIAIWIMAILADDFIYYWFHRTSHTIRLFWACHVVHHSSPNFNFSTAIRYGWMVILYKPFYWFGMAAIGFHPLMIITCAALNAMYQFFCHTDLLPFWDRLSSFLSTPGLHAIHHGKEHDCIDRNYAGIFIFYDRLFGTYQPIHAGQKISYGVTHPPRSDELMEITFHEFRNLLGCMRSSKSWKIKIKYMFNRPGWQPDHSNFVQ
ncbi:MAG: sterol desaturase family protein [Saprospiraceae bacterium]